MAVNNSLAQTSGRKTFSQAIATEVYQNMIATSIQDKKMREKFIADITAYVSSNKMLQECDNASILSAALNGNALGLSPVTGEYWVVPYKTKDGYKAQFQLGVQGRIQLALRSGKIAVLNTKEIHEGEYKGLDPNSGEPIFSFISDDVERESKPIVGYRAYVKLTNGFEKSIYFSKEKVLKWAARYSKAFDRDLYDRFMAGKVTDWKEQQRCSSPWYERFDTMACNTVLKQLLKWCPMSVEMQDSERYENVVDNRVVGDLDIQFEPIEATAEEVTAEEPVVEEAPKATAKATKKAKKAEPQEEIIDDDDFFGDNPFPNDEV